MATILTASFTTRREAEMTVERLVQEQGVDRAAIVVAPAGDANSAGEATAGAAKVALGERGPVWWDDGAPDLNRHMARTTCYADWYASGPGPQTP